MIFTFQTPLTESLIEFTDPAMNRVAADLFLCKFSPSLLKLHHLITLLSVCMCVYVFVWFVLVVMRFMGDSPSRGLAEQEVVSTFLKVNTQFFP